MSNFQKTSGKSLDKVIQKLDRVTQPSSSAQICLSVDLKKKEIRKSFLGTNFMLGGNVASYLISNNSDALNIAEYENLCVEVKDFSGNRSIGLHVAYRASCDSGQEDILAIALASEYSPEYELHQKIKGWIAFFTKGDSATHFIDNFLTDITELQRHLHDEAKKIGLNLEARIEPDKNPTYYLIKNAKDAANIAERRNFIVLLRDVSNTREIGVSINYQASFFPEDKEKVIKSLCSDKPIIETIDSKIKEWTLRFVDNVGTATFIENYSSELGKLQIFLEKKSREDAGLKLSLLATLDRNPIRYIISTISDPSKIAERNERNEGLSDKALRVLIHDIKSDRRINLVISYRAGYDPVDEGRIAQAFESSKSIREEIDKRLDLWVNTYIGNREADFIDQYSREKVESLVRFIQGESQKIGLRLDLGIVLERQNDLKPLPIGTEQSPAILPVRVIGCDDELQLQFWFKLSVDETKLVNAVIASPPGYETKIPKAVRDEIIKFFRETVSIRDFCYELKSKVRERLVDYLDQFVEQYGRKTVDLVLESETYFAVPRVVPIGSAKTPILLNVHVNDCDDELELLLHTELAIDEENLGKGAQYCIPTKQKTLEDAFKKRVKEFFNTEVTIKQFSSDLKGKVRDELLEFINDIFQRKYGHKVTFLLLDTSIDSLLPQEIIEVPCTIQCMVDGYPEAVSIKNTVQMLPQDLAKYRQMIPRGSGEMVFGDSPLEIWVKSKLEKVVKPLLLKRKYIELLTDLPTIAASIKEEMRKEARTIGFSVEHIVSAPELEHLELKQDFSIGEGQEVEYLTNDANVKVKLNTVVVSKIEEFQKVEEYLKPSVKIKDLMLETVQRTVSECLAKIDPERYYMRFYQAEPGLDSQSVEKELEDTIKAKLKERYGATVISVTPRPVNTDIADLFQELRGEIAPFDFEIDSLTGGESIKYYARFQIEGVGKESWYTFQARMRKMQRSHLSLRKELDRLEILHGELVLSSELGDVGELENLRAQMDAIKLSTSGIGAIRESVVSSIRQMLSTIDNPALAYIDSANLSALQDAINEWAGKGVREEYGLEISIRGLRRDRTEREKKLADVQNRLKLSPVEDAEIALKAATDDRETQLKMIQSNNKSKFAELEKLKEKRLKLITQAESDEDEDGIKYLDEKISKFEIEMTTTSLASTEDALKLLENKTSKAGNFLEARKQVKLPGSNPESSSDFNDEVDVEATSISDN
jgi:hypothetical protein